MISQSPELMTLVSDSTSFALAHGEIGQQESPLNGYLYLTRASDGLYCSEQCKSSYSTQPTDHISMAQSQYFSVSIISGALYHLDYTVLDISLSASVFFLIWQTFFLKDSYLETLFSSQVHLSKLLLNRMSLILMDSFCWSSVHDRLKPKSQSLIQHLESMRMFAGLISLCIMLAR